MSNYIVLVKQVPDVTQITDNVFDPETGTKMIPEGGYYAVPRDEKTGAIGRANVMILGDSAGFVNMIKIKGLQNAIDSGIQSAKAIVKTFDNPKAAEDQDIRECKNWFIG